MLFKHTLKVDPFLMIRFVMAGADPGGGVVGLQLPQMVPVPLTLYMQYIVLHSVQVH
jgi:hypothetical protein